MKDKLRIGYTTGSCAAGASLACAMAFEDGVFPKWVDLETPAGKVLKLEVLDPEFDGQKASCAIKKDAGDDPDTTNGILIYAQLRKRNDQQIKIDGGTGIGTIHKKGLFGQVGEKAINPVPREMIEKAIKSVSKSGFDCLIYAPEGEEIGKKTYNENMGIYGGISIIGTSGLVYPMSEKALLDTIDLEINVVANEYGLDKILLVPGNYGEKMKEKLDLDIPFVQMSNYIGDTLNMVYERKFKKIILLGHIGKFSKLAMGVFNTHSKNCDLRLEAFSYYLYKRGIGREFIEEVEGLNTGEEAMNLCISKGYKDVILDMEQGAIRRIKRYLKDPDLDVDVYIYSMEKGLCRRIDD